MIFFRKKKIENSVFFQLSQRHSLFAISVITEYEILTGATPEQQVFWDDFLSNIVVLPFDSETNKVAVQIFKQLKADNKLLDIPDILIAATALQNDMKLATINRKHFERIDKLLFEM